MAESDKVVGNGGLDVGLIEEGEVKISSHEMVLLAFIKSRFIDWELEFDNHDVISAVLSLPL